MSVSVLSEIDLMLSNVNVELSSVSFKMSSLPVKIRPNYLPRIGVLLSTIESLVSSSSTSSSYYASSCSDLSWDSNHDYYVYSEKDDDEFDLNMNIVEECDGAVHSAGSEECVKDLSACGEECMIDLADCDQEQVIAVPTSREKCVIDDSYAAEYHSLMFPTAKQVSQMFPAVMVASMFPTNQEIIVSSESTTSSVYSVSMRSPESMTSSITSDSNTTVEWIYIDYTEVEEDLTTKLIKFINIVAPGAVFSLTKSRRRRRKKIIKSIHPELRCVFLNSRDLCSPSPFSAASPVNHPPVPIVDWSKVNQRGLGNLPQPKMFPKHGCSNDPNDYAPRIDDHGGVRVTHPSPHQKPFPFGGEFGMMTDLGIISTNKGDHMEDPYNNIIHGHVWSRELCCWVIHARFAKDNKPKSAKEGGRNSRKPKKKEVESR